MQYISAHKYSFQTRINPKHFRESKIKLFVAKSSLLGPAGVRVAVVLYHREEALLLVEVLGEAVEAHTRMALSDISLKSTSSSPSSSSSSP